MNVVLCMSIFISSVQMYTTGLVFFAECPKHSVNIILHSTNNTQQTFYRQRVLCRVLLSKTLGKLRIAKKTKKTENIFKIMRINYPTTTHYYHTPPSPYYFFIIFCEWWVLNSQPLSRIYSSLPLHYYINYVYITFSFFMYYNKLRVIWLIEALTVYLVGFSR
jgi:hypothetical protein